MEGVGFYGEYIERFIPYDLLYCNKKGHPTYKAQCKNCGSRDLPQIILGGGSAGGGKQCLLDSNICTPFGFRKLRDIKVGSIITNPNTGGMQKVIWLHPIEKHNYYRVHFVDGTHCDCSEGHLWKCHESKRKSKRAKYNDIDNDIIWSTKSMFEWYEKKKSGVHADSNLIIPLTKPVKFTVGDKKPSVDPYILGAIIGDGCITNSVIQNNVVQFSTMDSEIVDRFVQAGYDMSHYSQKPESRANYYTIKDQKLVDEIKKLGIS